MKIETVKDGWHLEHCPFCGMKAELQALTDKHIHKMLKGYMVQCCYCRAMTGSYLSAGEAVEAWNERVDK